MARSAAMIIESYREAEKLLRAPAFKILGIECLDHCRGVVVGECGDKLGNSRGRCHFQPRCGLTPCASAAGACGAAARPKAESTRAAAPRQRPGQQQARVRWPQRHAPPASRTRDIREAARRLPAVSSWRTAATRAPALLLPPSTNPSALCRALVEAFESATHPASRRREVGGQEALGGPRFGAFELEVLQIAYDDAVP